MEFATVNLNPSFGVLHAKEKVGMMLLEVSIYVIICIRDLHHGSF